MIKMTVTQFKKNILFKGKFEQYVVTPYSSQELVWGIVLVLSDQVKEVTSIHIRNKKKPTAIILPYVNNIYDSIAKHSYLLPKVTRVDAPYFGVFNLPKKSSHFIDDKPLFEVRIA